VATSRYGATAVMRWLGLALAKRRHAIRCYGEPPGLSWRSRSSMVLVHLGGISASGEGFTSFEQRLEIR
jgi:hypothetical protein